MLNGSEPMGMRVSSGAIVVTIHLLCTIRRRITRIRSQVVMAHDLDSNTCPKNTFASLVYMPPAN